MKRSGCLSIRILLCLVWVSLFLTATQESHCFQKQYVTSQEYRDPKGFFTMLPPSNWLIREYPDDPRGKVAFLHPNIRNLNLRVIAQAADYKSFGELNKNAEIVASKIRTQFNGQVSIERSSLGDAPALRIKITIPDQLKQLQYQFLRGRMYYNLAYSAPPNSYEDFLQKVTNSIATFEPTSQDVTTEDVVQHSVSAKVRRAKLFIEMGKLELAQEAVDEGLKIQPANSELRELKKIIEEKRK
jgi:hypothetical protein